MADEVSTTAPAGGVEPSANGSAPSGMLKRRSRSASLSRSVSKGRSASRSRSPPRRKRRSSRSRSRSPRRRHHRRRRHSSSRSRSPRRRRDDRRSSRRSRRRSHSRSRSPGYGYSRRGRDNRDYRQYDRRGLPRNSRRAQKADRSPSTESQKARAHTRDARTIFVSQLVRKATEKDIKRYFEQVGKVRHVNLITDRSGASKGIAYVEFKHLETVPQACLLNGQQFCTKHRACTCSGFPILVKDSEAHKNHLYRAQKALEDKSKAGEGGADAMLARGGNMPHPMMGMATGAPGGASMVPGTSDVPASWRIHVGNLPVGTTGDELRAIFSAFGEVSSTSVRFDTGRPTGYGFVHFCAEKPAQLAMSAPPIELRGLTIKVNSVNLPQSSGGDWQLDDEPLGGVALNSNQRIDLMNRLAGKTAAPAPMPTPAVPTTTFSTVVAGEPSRCLIVRNMFNPAEETEAHWDRDIEEDVADESKKYGQLVHIFVDKHSAGHVYMMFKQLGHGQAAAKDLHGRFFARRRLTCEYIPDSKYLQKFPKAESK